MAGSNDPDHLAVFTVDFVFDHSRTVRPANRERCPDLLDTTPPPNHPVDTDTTRSDARPKVNLGGKKLMKHEWIECRVSPGMFRDERVVEVSGRSFFVDEKSVRKQQGHSEVLVTIIQANGRKQAVLPTQFSESVELGA